ncbi:MAG: class I SAM-dependent methyltransferase [Opitutaceae bacterium]|nr:class I SAM-dependent methyltransferase [Opitutaceae bacterium]
MLALLDERLSPGFELFEYGSGFSTEYFARRCKRVISVEYDATWYEKVKAKVPAHVTVVHVPIQDVQGYSGAIAGQATKFDVVLVDGAHRVECLRAALPALSESGVVILDDSSREEYRPGFEMMKAAGFREITLVGMKPTHPGMHSTTLFYRDRNCLGL